MKSFTNNESYTPPMWIARGAGAGDGWRGEVGEVTGKGCYVGQMIQCTIAKSSM